MAEHFWWCNRCRSRVADQQVTLEEYHDGCGGIVIAVKEEPECLSCEIYREIAEAAIGEEQVRCLHDAALEQRILRGEASDE